MSAATTRQARRLMAIAALLASGAVLGQSGQSGAADALDLLAQENQVYSAARYTQTLAETPANVSIISRDDIRSYGYRTVSDALKSLPGVYDAASQWPALGVSGFAVPGDFNSRILYLVNGMPVYEPTYGGFFLEYLDIDSVERIEFVKGAGSALYGSGAVLGIVNLITHSGKDAAGSTASIEVASHRSGKLYYSSNVHGPRVSSFVAASVAYTGGRDVYLPEFDNPAFNNARFGGVAADNDNGRTARLFARYTMGRHWLQAMLVGGSKRDPLASYATVFNGRLMLRESLATLEAGTTRDLGEGGKLDARVFAFAATERGDYPYATAGARGLDARYINVSDLASRQIGAEVRYDRFISRDHHILVGIEIKHIGYSHQVGDQPGLTRDGVFSVDRSDSYMQWALFAQDEMRLGPGTVFLGARLDSYHGFSKGVTSRLSPRISYVQELSHGVSGKLIYGEAYRAPTIYESRYQDGRPAASTIWANGALQPEVSRSLEAMLIAQSASGLQWRLSGFFKHLHRTPVQVSTPVLDRVACNLGPTGCIQYRNFEPHQSTVGVELDMRVRQGDYGDYYASLVLQRGRGAAGDLPSSPRQLFKAGYSRALPWPDLDAGVELQYTGSVYGRKDEDIAVRDHIPGYLLAGAVVNAVRLGDGWRASLRVDNLFDRHYDTVASRELHPLRRVPADGRRFSLQLLREF
ncbi:TonB-dependent receptor [Massilia sp. PAMC28688]|uniref:TonB-dependent receptor plug domain-containing protein n=1 Tax=Massilia sp. PAMC28688 TaxID=2861283 RepID=UPI001C633360|nr:TonB-dependent receptor [Massilia sp. PAMC28688]QYF92160.1 TonB-dependent receptor [Massilia sp. PAMC28688]